MPEPAPAPASVHVAALSLTLAVSVQVGLVVLTASQSAAGWGQFLFAAAVFGLLLWGIMRGYRLAWLWGRYLALFLAVVEIVAIAAAWWQKRPMSKGLVALVLAGLVVPLFVAAFALARPGALRWFDLMCPKCGAPAGRANDFFFRKARCSKCGNTW